MDKEFKELIDKHRLHLPNNSLEKFLPPNSIMFNVTNADNEGREMLDWGKYNLDMDRSIAEQASKLNLDKIDIDPLFVLLGVCEDEYVYGVVPRAIYQEEEGPISCPIMSNFKLIDGFEDSDGNIEYKTKDNVTYVKSKIIEELPYLKKTYSDDILGVGEEIPGGMLAVYNDSTYERLKGFNVGVYPCGEDEKYMYSYIVWAGNILINRGNGHEPHYGMYILSAPDGKIILSRQEKQ